MSVKPPISSTSQSENPVVFVPGSMCDGRVFRTQLSRVRRPTILADVCSDNTIDAMAVRLLDNAPETFTLVGLSLGAIVATEVAARAPERVTGLAILDSNLDAPDSEQLLRRHRWASDIRAGHFIDIVAELIPEMTVWPSAHGNEILEMARDLGPAVFLDQNHALIHRHDRRPLVAGLDMPVLVACGELDQICSPDAHRELASTNLDAEFAVIAGAGHLSTIDQPEHVGRLLDGWIEKCKTHTNRGKVHETTTK